MRTEFLFPIHSHYSFTLIDSMGDTQSTLTGFSLPIMDNPDDQHPCFCINEDSLNLLYADSRVQGAINKAMNGTHVDILREECVESNWWTCHLRRRLFKRDNVFGESENQQLRSVRLRLLNRLFAEFEVIGFELFMGFKLLRKCPENYSSLVWKKCEPRPTVTQDHFLCIDLINSDRLAIVHSDRTVRRAVVEEVLKVTPGLVRSSCDLEEGMGIEIRFSTDLWNVKRVGGEGRFLLLRLFEALAENGWEFHTAGNFSEDETLVFRKSAQPVSKRAFVLISLEQHNLIRIVSHDPATNVFIYESIGSNWLKQGGVSQTTDPADTSMLLKLSGSPWRTHKFSTESMATKWMLSEVFERCWQRGWRVAGSFDKSDNAKSIYVLENCEALNTSVFAIALAGKWMLRVMHAPRLVIEKIKETIHKKWYKEVYLEQVDDSCWVINLGGNPWSKQVIPGLTLLLQIVVSLKKLGWHLFLSAKSSGIYTTGKAYDSSSQQRKKFHQAEIDTLWFHKKITGNNESKI